MSAPASRTMTENFSCHTWALLLGRLFPVHSVEDFEEEVPLQLLVDRLADVGAQATGPSGSDLFLGQSEDVGGMVTGDLAVSYFYPTDSTKGRQATLACHRCYSASRSTWSKSFDRRT